LIIVLLAPNAYNKSDLRKRRFLVVDNRFQLTIVEYFQRPVEVLLEIHTANHWEDQSYVVSLFPQAHFYNIVCGATSVDHLLPTHKLVLVSLLDSYETKATHKHHYNDSKGYYYY
jgi:hypothetical protein